MRFPRNNRLVIQAEYQSLFKKAHKVSHRFLKILFKKNHCLQGRLGLIVAKRVAKKAVTRNQIKRVIRESFRLHQEKLMGIDIIVIARQPCDIISKQVLREGIDKLWEKLLTSQSNVLS
ncbi:MAG: ribonuclease P protein component [Gammaproteobacteria bacterium]|nr:ribonuclease P protein component [Gammaproteobacteria bacterium]